MVVLLLLLGTRDADCGVPLERFAWAVTRVRGWKGEWEKCVASRFASTSSASTSVTDGDLCVCMRVYVCLGQNATCVYMYTCMDLCECD